MTLSFDVYAGHPYEEEVNALLTSVRAQVLELWNRVSTFNAQHFPEEEPAEKIVFTRGRTSSPVNTTRNEMGRGTSKRTRRIDLLGTTLCLGLTSIALPGCLTQSVPGTDGSLEWPDAAPPGADAGRPVLDASNGAPDPDGAAVPPFDDSIFTLVPSTAADDSAPVTTPHTLFLLRRDNAFSLQAQTDARGRVSLPLEWHMANVQIRGEGPADVRTSTYDTVLLNFDTTSADRLLRISTVGIADLPALVAGFTPRPDRAALSGTVYVTSNGRRVGTVGCAKLYLDGATDADADADQRYNAGGGLPTTLATQGQTLPPGRFYFGNISEGPHTLRVSVDEGATFIATSEFFVPYTRAQALSDHKGVIMQLAIDREGANPTPPSCF